MTRRRRESEIGQRARRAAPAVGDAERAPEAAEHPARARDGSDERLHAELARLRQERLPERVLFASGAGAHGHFRLYESLERYSCAAIFTDATRSTDVFVRFSAWLGAQGSADTLRDVRGFATRFHTAQGDFDLVGSNMPVCFARDGAGFARLMSALQPTAAHALPRGSTAHDAFWAFVAETPEAAHMLLWLMSDRALPRSYRMMEGFGVHTFRLVNAAGQVHLVKFHWKPLLGAHALAWDEAQLLAGRDPDFLRRDLWEAIESGAHPVYELGLQLVPEPDGAKLGIDLLDSTKLLPEELAPVLRVGKLTLDRNPRQLAESEQVAFHPGNLVPGIELSDDPLLQARVRVYADAQHARNATGVCAACGEHGHMTRDQRDTARDELDQARLFVRSLSFIERAHLVHACRLDLARLSPPIRQRALALLSEIDPSLSETMAEGLGLERRSAARAARAGSAHLGQPGALYSSPALSLDNQPKTSIATRRVAVLAEKGFATEELVAVQAALTAAGARVEIVSSELGQLEGVDGHRIAVDRAFSLGAPGFHDAVFVPGGAESVEVLSLQTGTFELINEAFKHGKAIAACNEGINLLANAELSGTLLADDEEPVSDRGVLTARTRDLAGLLAAFAAAIAKHRHWDRGLRLE